MTRLAIIGISGRMGSEIRALAAENGYQVVAGVASDAGARIEGAKVVDRISKLEPAEIDVLIDFSLPKITDEVLEWCAKSGKPLVSGVTGISDEQKGALAKAASRAPILWSPNMSLGVAVLASLLKGLSSLEGFDFQVEELHHNRKKDKPSGTALFLQERLGQAVKAELPEPVAIRGGGIFGIHRIWAMGEEEVLTLEHTAMNRRVFARGALKAAAWLKSRPPGLYRMDDVLNGTAEP